MTSQLHDELTRIGEAAPPVAPTADLAPDLWRRGRRARTRDRVVGAGAALALVAALGGATVAVAGGPTRILPASPPPGDPAVPSTLHPVPTHVQRDTARHTSDLAVGRSSVAFVTDRGVPVVISATGASYSLLDLPGWPYHDPTDLESAETTDIHPLALSPDGYRLAWGYDDSSGTGLRTADLRTGEVMSYPVRGGPESPIPKLSITSVGWSGDSGRLAWSGQTRSPYKIWYGHLLVLDSWTPEQGPEDPPVTVGVSGAGATLAYVNGFARISSAESAFQDDSFFTDALEQPSSIASFSPDGRLVLFGSTQIQDHVDVGVIEDGRVLKDGRVLERGLPPDVYPGGAVAQPLGWVDDETAVVLARANDDTDLAQPHIALMSAPTVPEQQWTYRIVTRTVPTGHSGAVASYHTVAVDLLAAPTVDLPAPDWPWSIERRITVGTVSGVAVAGIGLLLWRRRRW